MKKLLALACLLCSTSAFTSEWTDEGPVSYELRPHRTQMDCPDFPVIWREIYTYDYGLALYHLKDMDNTRVETSIHGKLMELYIAVRKHDVREEYEIMSEIDGIVSESYMEE